MITKQSSDSAKEARHRSGPPRASVGSASSKTSKPQAFVPRTNQRGNTTSVQLTSGLLVVLAAGTVLAPGVSSLLQGSAIQIGFNLLPAVLLTVAAFGLIQFQMWGWWAGTTLLYSFLMFSGFGIIGHLAGLQATNLLILAPMMIASGVAIKQLSSDEVIQSFVRRNDADAPPKKVGPAMLGSGLTLFLILLSSFL